MMKPVLFVIITFSLFSCTKHQGVAAGDVELFSIAKNSEGYTWFKLSDTLMEKSSGTGHEGFLRVRFNAIAARQLDSVGQIKANASFETGSIVIKELFTTRELSTLRRYAILYKKPEHPDADAKGWVWGYINPDGSVAESSTKKGSACISCHSQSGNSDYMLMGKYFP